MAKLDYVYGFLIALIAAAIGCCICTYVFITFFTDYDFMQGVAIFRQEGKFSRLIKLGALPNLGVFFLMLKYKKDNMAKGVIAAIVFLGILTFFV